MQPRADPAVRGVRAAAGRRWTSVDRPTICTRGSSCSTGSIGRLRTMADGRAIVLADRRRTVDDAVVGGAAGAPGRRAVTSDQLRVVLTLRHHELVDNEPLATTARRLARGQACRDVAARAAVRHRDRGACRAARAARITTGRPPRTEPGDLRALTGGNPLFVIQVAQSGRRTRRAFLPRSSTCSVGTSTACHSAVGEASRRPRCWAWTARWRCWRDAPAVTSSTRSRRSMLSATAGCCTSGRSTVDTSFVHELARHTVTAQIPPGRAMRLHLAIADGMQDEPQPDVFAIAHHLRLAMPVAPAAARRGGVADARRDARTSSATSRRRGRSPSRRSTRPTRWLRRPTRWC